MKTQLTKTNSFFRFQLNHCLELADFAAHIDANSDSGEALGIPRIGGVRGRRKTTLKVTAGTGFLVSR